MTPLLVLAVILWAAAIPVAVRALAGLTLRAVGGCLIWAAVLSGVGAFCVAFLSGHEWAKAVAAHVLAVAVHAIILLSVVAWVWDLVYGVTGPRPPREIPPHPWDRTN